ncbi:MAG: ABC transporter permease [Alphaproteobacteria bacterium]|jgi:phospholipid/cholesterol/gamma-HCH transport system permease protein|nr:ABC transporter permease [Alphaproteobacteria bacterium]
MAEQTAPGPQRSLTEAIGRQAIAGVAAFTRGIEAAGMGMVLLVQSFGLLFFGRLHHQPVRLPSVVAQMLEIGIHAVPIASVLAFMIGMTLAMQGIDLLKTFGAESQVVLAAALSVTREFAPLIMGVLVAGRSGSALAARIGTMVISQEIDALRVMGISPVRYLVVPALLSMLIMVPLLTFLADILGLLGAALYTHLELGMSLRAFADATLEALTVDHVMHGISKSFIFGGIIALVSVVNGFAVSGGAEQVGQATTKTVVQSIAGIIITDMLIIFILTR